MSDDPIKTALWELFWNLPAGQQVGIVSLALVVAGIGFAVGNWSGGVSAKAKIIRLEGQLEDAPPLGSSATKCEITILSPKDNEPVPQTFRVEAIVKDIPEGSVPWVVTTERTNPSHYWPQGPAVEKEGIWVGKVDGIGGYVGKQRSFGIFAVGRDGQLLIDAWREGWQKGREPLKARTLDTLKCVERDVIVKSLNSDA